MFTKHYNNCHDHTMKQEVLFYWNKYLLLIKNKTQSIGNKRDVMKAFNLIASSLLSSAAALLLCFKVFIKPSHWGFSGVFFSVWTTMFQCGPAVLRAQSVCWWLLDSGCWTRWIINNHFPLHVVFDLHVLLLRCIGVNSDSSWFFPAWDIHV